MYKFAVLVSSYLDQRLHTTNILINLYFALVFLVVLWTLGKVGPKKLRK